MSTAVKTFVFASDLEGLADAGLSGDITVSWISDDGSPSAGCLSFAFSGSLTAEDEQAVNPSTGETWQDWGVPEGATVTHVQVTAYQHSYTENGKVTALQARIRIVDSTGDSVTDDTTANLIDNAVGVDGFTWTAGSAGSQIAVNSDRQDEDTDVRLLLETVMSAGNGNNSDYRFDTIEITITYEAAAANNVVQNVIVA